jgi:hypothetical protein
MAPVMEKESKREERQEIGERHRVLIAAAAAALVGSRFRILEINPVEEPSETGWERRGDITRLVKRAVLRRRIRIRVKAVRKEEKRETSHHA